MILCPNCLHKEMVGALFCGECGTQLIFLDGVPTSTFSTSALSHEVSIRTEAPVAPAIPLEADVSLNVINSGEILHLPKRKETTLGRVSKGQPIIPDIDLTPYRAYEAGVSRMHVSIRVMEDQIVIIDLGSANGTRVNGRKISSHIPYPINHGDVLTLGKFKIQILVQANHRFDGG